ncbi:odorant receptor 13a-like [Chelonus insularis]|uniref:odorant receptor 13a-like n=1 Tax=Chelonus insularis TaxID=460826 RepID=UPI00158BA2E0|nr:odorant receptor 13a-like [Chelonus insularis]
MIFYVPDPEVKKILHNGLNYEKFFDKIFIALGCFLTIALLFFLPKNEGSLPVRAIFPFDTNASPKYELAYVVQAFSIIYGLSAIVFMDELVVTIVMWINVQLTILNADFQHSATNNMRGMSNHARNKRETDYFIELRKYKAGALNQNFVENWKICIVNHQKLIGLVYELNDIFSSSMLLQLFASFSMICLAGFQVVLGADEKTNFIKFALYLGAALSQLLNWCWFGNELLHKVSFLNAIIELLFNSEMSFHIDSSCYMSNKKKNKIFNSSVNLNPDFTKVESLKQPGTLQTTLMVVLDPSL